MADTGLPWSLPYPLLTDQPNGPVATQNLAAQTALVLGRALPCTLATLPAHKAGLIIYTTDVNKAWISDGATWLQIAFGDDTGWIDAVANGATALTGYTLVSGFLVRRNGIAGLNLTLTTTAAIAAGDIANLALVQLPGGWIPFGSSGSIGSSGAGPSWQGYVNGGDGKLYMSSTSTAMGAGSTFSAIGTYML